MIIDGVEIIWDGITRDQLKHLSYEKMLPDSIIAEKFGVSVSKVRYKRKKFNLSSAVVCREKFEEENAGIFDELNKRAKEWFMTTENLDPTAKAIACFIFRNNGVIEDFHVKYGIPNTDMKELNICMVNRIAGLLTYAMNGDWHKLRMLLGYCNMFTSGWNPAEPETEELEIIYEMGKALRSL
jgi:DNA-binding Lrp family transcriptional regulator